MKMMALGRLRVGGLARARCLSIVNQPLVMKFDAATHDLSVSGQHQRVVFGANAARDQLGSIARAAGIRKMLVVRDNDAGAAARTKYAEFLLMQAGIPCFEFTVKRDCATVEGIDEALATAQRVGADGLLAFGGGNAMDMTRAVAVLLTNAGEASSFIRGETGKDLEAPAPHIIVPTTAGAGVEISTKALILDEDEECKQSFVSMPILAEAVIVDPMLALSVPLQPSVQGALAALGQCIESYLTGCQDEATDKLALQGIESIAIAFAEPLREGKMNPKHVATREYFALGSLLSGVCATSSGSGAAQSIAVAMGGISDLPHTQIASAFLPFVLDRYAQIAEENQGDEYFDTLREKLEHVADHLTAFSGFQGASTSAWVRYVASRFDLPTTDSMELDEQHIKGTILRAAMYQDAVHSEPPVLEKDDLQAILGSALTVKPEDNKTDKE